MIIAVTSQNRKTVTEHASRCRKFWLFTVQQQQVTGKELLELPKEMSLRESGCDAAHPLDTIDVLLSAGMGERLQQRLARKGIRALTTTETDPDQAVSRYLAAGDEELH